VRIEAMLAACVISGEAAADHIVEKSGAFLQE
jgi:hypothetical protein